MTWKAKIQAQRLHKADKQERVYWVKALSMHY